MRRLLINVVVIMILTGITTSSSYATNGYFRHGYGTQYRGIAGAGVALSLSSLASATNPASMVYVGKRFDIGFSVFMPLREYTVTGNPSGFPGTFGLAPGTIESDSKVFPIPSLGANWMLNPQTSFGIALYGNGGMNTNYDTPTFGFAPTGVDLSQAFIAPTISRKLNPNHSVGVTTMIVFQRFKAEGLTAFAPFSSDPANLTDNGYDTSLGFGLKVGYLGNLSSLISIGASFQTKMYMSEFDKYAGLFSEQGDFDIPASWTAGIAVHATPALTLAFDVQQVLYSGVAAINNPFNAQTLSPVLPDGVTANPNFKPLGSDDGSGFGWEDMTIFKFGAQFEANPGLTLRGGFSFGGQPIPDSEVLFNILAPGVVENHATVGLTKTFASGKDISFAIMRAFSKSISGLNPLEAPVPGQQTIELKMNQWEFEVTFGL